VGEAIVKGRARLRLPIVALLLWAIFAFVVPRFVQALNVVDVLAFPLGYFMAAQGSLIVFVVIAILSARRQNHAEQGTSHGDE
jgi:putative solute:sodium symporter small subunit